MSILAARGTGKKGYVHEDNPNDPNVMGVMFEGAQTPEWIPVSDLQIVPHSRIISNNMTQQGGNQQQMTQEEYQAMLAHQQRLNSGMGTGAKIGLLFLVAILICGMLGGLYLYLGSDDESEDRRRESSFVDLEAGPRMSRRSRMSRRASAQPQPDYLSGKELDRAADRHRSRRSRRRKIDRDVSRSRSQRRSRNVSRSASRQRSVRRSRDERRRRGDRSQNRRSHRGERSKRSARSPHVVVDMSGARQN